MLFAFAVLGILLFVFSGIVMWQRAAGLVDTQVVREKRAPLKNGWDGGKPGGNR